MTGLPSGEVAKAAGVNQQTLRYYERRGLLAEPERTLGGRRVYSPGVLTVLPVIKAAQRLGFTLDEVADLLKIGAHPGGAHPQEGLAVRAATKLDEVEAKIADLLIIRDSLRAALEAGCDDLIACAESPACPLPSPTSRKDISAVLTPMCDDVSETSARPRGRVRRVDAPVQRIGMTRPGDVAGVAVVFRA
jgi:MerR family mercuric resistance operon transcriptional regulator